MLVPIANTPRDYAWGSSTLIAELEGRTPTGAPEAEVWFGDHPGSPAVLPDGRALNAALAEAGHDRLPYLLKLLAAGSPLSIQVHPTKAQAQAGFAAEAHLAADSPERNYRDDNHKPEMIVALSDTFEALCGLRPMADTLRYLAELGEATVPLRERLTGPGDDAASLRETIAWLLSGDAQDTVDAVIASLATAESDEFAGEITAHRRIASFYPGDPGVIVAMLMNYLVLRRGEAVYLRAGLLHAYLSGLGVEIMAASDNVLRGGLTPKRVDVAELMKLTDTAPAPAQLLQTSPLIGAEGVITYGPGIADFAIAKTNPASESATLSAVDTTMFLATAGEITVTIGDEQVTLVPGKAALYLGEPAEASIAGPGEAFIATPGE